MSEEKYMNMTNKFSYQREHKGKITCKFDLFTLSPEDLKEIDRLTGVMIDHGQNIENRHCIHLVGSLNDFIVLDSFTTLLSKAYNYLTKYGYQVCVPDKDCVNVEYHTYLSDGIDVPSNFSWHKDNEGATSYPVHTCIFYLEHTFEIGGELIIENNEDDHSRTENHTIVVDPRRYDMILLSGETWHSISPCRGKGVRRCLVLQLRTLDSLKSDEFELSED